MKFTSVRNNTLIVMAALVFLMQACITDEFRAKDISIDGDWEIGIVTPIFSGQLEFRDFIHNWYLPVPQVPAPDVVLDYNDKPDVPIYAEMIFDKSAVIDSFPFYIQGRYQFTAVDLVFTVENGSPFPLNLELFFYEKREFYNFGPAISPPPFQEAEFNNTPVIPAKTIETVSLSDAQLAYFIKGNRVKLDSWFNRNDFILHNDTLSAHYPIHVSVVLVGKVKAKQND